MGRVNQEIFDGIRRAVVLVAFIVLASLFVLQYPSLVVLFFASILVAAVIQGMAAWLASRWGIRYGFCLALVLVGLLLLFAGLGALIGLPFVYQIDELKRTLPAAFQQLLQKLQNNPLVQQAAEQLPPMDQLINRVLSGRVFGFFSGLVGALTSAAVILVIAIYLSVSPGLYTEGVLFLFPHRNRERMREVLRITAHSLRFWMLGQVLSMIVIGLLTGLGLWIIGIPLALSLGVIAGLFTFVPIVGPLAAAVPGVLLGFSLSITQALYVVLVYVGVQLLEGNLITPLIQLRAVSLPPVLLLAAQTLFGTLIGMTGIIFAAPMTVAIVVLIQLLYVQDVIGDDVQPMGPPNQEAGPGPGGEQREG